MGNRGFVAAGCVCNRVLTRSNGVTARLSVACTTLDMFYSLVRAVTVEPVAAAMIFAWKGSMAVVGRRRA